MLDVNPRLIFAALFLAGLSALLWLDRKNVNRHFILFYRRTDRGLELIDRIASKFPRFWKFYGAAGVVTGLLSIVAVAILVGYTFFDMFTSGTAQDGPALVLPGLGSEATWQAGASFIPVEYWVLGIAVLMFVHEMSHGIIARTEGFEINSVGWIVLGIIPGAFVEPKGENMLPGGDGEVTESTTIWEGGDWKSRLKVLCAGSWANYLTAALFMVLAFGVSSAVAEPGDLFYQAEEEFPAYDEGMMNGTLIAVNGVKVSSVEDLQRETENVQPGDQVELWTSEGNFTVTTVEREGFEGGYIGIRMGQTQEIKPQYEPYQSGLQWFVSLLYTVGLLNFLIGLFNMLPIKPLDGGLSVETLIMEFWDEDKVSYLNTFSLLGWALILGSIILALVGF